jgi:hypothetical protein
MTRSSGAPRPSTTATCPARITKKSQFRSPSANRISSGCALRRWPMEASAAIWASLSRGYAPCRSGVSSDVGFVDIASAPVVSRLEGHNDRVPDRVGVAAGVPERGRVAAADMPAGQAEPQMHPRRPRRRHSSQPSGVRGGTGQTMVRCGSLGTDVLAFRVRSAYSRLSGTARPHIFRPGSCWVGGPR